MASTTWLLLFGVATVGGAGLAAPHVAGSGLGSPGFGEATGAVLAALPEPIRLRAAHVHLCFSDAPDEAFVERVWSVGQAPVSVWAAWAWRAEMGRASYRSGATHVLVGPVSWLLDSLALKPRVFEVRNKDDKVKRSLQEVDGYVADLMRVLEHHLNFTSVLTATNTFGTQFLNGSWNGMLGFLTRGEADMSPLDFSPSWKRAQAVDFSEWFSTDGVVIISKAPKTIQLPFLLLQIFSGWVWLAILVVGVMTGNLMWVLDYLLQHVSNRPHSEHGMHQQQQQQSKLTYSDAVTTTLKLFLTQSSKMWCMSWSGRVLCSCLFLVVVSVVALYQGYIIAFLAVPRMAVPIDSATHLMGRLPYVTPIVRKNTVYYHFVVNFESYSPIAANLKFHQDSFLNTWDFFQLIYQGKYALIDTYSSGVGRAARFESRTECRFHVSRQVLKADLDLMAHPQNSIFREHFDQALRRLRSFGIIEEIKNQYYSTSCGKELTKRDPLALSLTQVQSAFYLLAVGLIISLMEFILEIIKNLCSN